jgi:uncharacterized FAD-dependent dehydrogenase
MLIYHQLKLNYFHSDDDLRIKIGKLLRITDSDLISVKIVKKSIDARKKPQIYVVYSLLLEVKNEELILKKVKDRNLMKYSEKTYVCPRKGELKLAHRPIVIGAGPSGLFATYLLAKQGFSPILLERGKKIEDRDQDVERFWKDGILDENSNVQFGEGGAGTYSDGKLNTGVKDKNSRMRFVLETLVEFGASSSILFDAKPHVGTDVLKFVMTRMREEIISLGGEVRFSSKVTDFVFESNQIRAVEVNHSEKIDTDICILAIGHSARDTFTWLYNKQVDMEKKNFSIGLRVEHPREMIDALQYGKENVGKIEAAPYKLTYQTKENVGVYSFCMCPGGFVVNASSEKGRLAINGMSYQARKAKNSNTAIVVQVDEQTFADDHPLAGMYFQQKIEELAFRQGNGKIIIQRYEDFCKNQISSIDQFAYLPEMKGDYQIANIREVLPQNISESFIEGMEYFGRRMSGYNGPNTILSGVETRTSSPVRIPRTKEFNSTNVIGLYPCGEGAGYAGGIISAAMDGMKVAEQIISTYNTK